MCGGGSTCDGTRDVGESDRSRSPAGQPQDMCWRNPVCARTELAEVRRALNTAPRPSPRTSLVRCDAHCENKGQRTLVPLSAPSHCSLGMHWQRADARRLSRPSTHSRAGMRNNTHPAIKPLSWWQAAPPAHTRPSAVPLVPLALAVVVERGSLTRGLGEGVLLLLVHGVEREVWCCGSVSSRAVSGGRDACLPGPRVSEVVVVVVVGAPMCGRPHGF